MIKEICRYELIKSMFKDLHHLFWLALGFTLLIHGFNTGLHWVDISVAARIAQCVKFFLGCAIIVAKADAENTLELIWLKILIAPRLFILEHLADKVKQLKEGGQVDRRAE